MGLGFCSTVEFLGCPAMCLFTYPISPPQYCTKLCFRGPLTLQMDRQVWGQGMASNLEESVDGFGFWESLLEGKFSADCLEKSRE